jgi:hypothetical protein
MDVRAAKAEAVIVIVVAVAMVIMVVVIMIMVVSVAVRGALPVMIMMLAHRAPLLQSASSSAMLCGGRAMVAGQH